jgi:tRNA uridine 5-carbamoylmethylation protein Kti12
MALVTVSGYPCSGKSRRVEQLKTYLESRISEPSSESDNVPPLKVVVISDDSLNLKRDAYNGPYPIKTQIVQITQTYTKIDSRSEKPARGALFTAMQRFMGKDTILIVDSLNYIKGFRYQMYCAAREHRLRMCTVRFVSCAKGSALFIPVHDRRCTLWRPRNNVASGTKIDLISRTNIPPKRLYEGSINDIYRSRDNLMQSR